MNQWGIKLPRIVAFLISNADILGEWVTSGQLQRFKIGLSKVNTQHCKQKSLKLINTICISLLQAVQQTNIWIFTNGANVGVSRIVGEIIEEVHEERRLYK